jgi:hypothetical protein
VYGRRVLRRTLGCKKEEEIGGWKKLHLRSFMPFTAHYRHLQNQINKDKMGQK